MAPGSVGPRRGHRRRSAADAVLSAVLSDGAGTVDTVGEDGTAGLHSLRAAFVEQQRRIGDDPALALLVAAESASGLAAVEMTRAGLPWRADVHREILGAALGAPTPPGSPPATLAGPGGADRATPSDSR